MTQKDMKVTAAVSTLLFDFGNVFIDIDFAKTTDQLAEFGIRVGDVKELLFDPKSPFRLFQIGKLSGVEFRESMRALATQAMDDETIDRVWCAMLGSVAPEMVTLLQGLRGKYQLVLFSNTDDIHAEQFEREFLESYGFEMHTLFDRVYYSQRIGSAKPDREAFDYVIRDLQVNPANVLFLDDIAANIEGAIKAGLQAVQVTDHCNPKPILEGLKLL